MAELYPYQKDAVRKLLSGKHIIVAQCGAGKTAIALKWAENCPKKKLLVLTTASKAHTCFPAGVKVRVPNGEKNIEDIKEGDIVYSYQRKIGVRENKVAGLVKYDTDKRKHAEPCTNCIIPLTIKAYYAIMVISGTHTINRL